MFSSGVLVAQTILNALNAPHLVLGMRSDAPVADATVAFARLSRRVKNSSDSPFVIEDLTSALSELENTSKNPEFALKFTIPANPSVIGAGVSFAYLNQEMTSSSDLSTVELAKIEIREHERAANVFLEASVKEVLNWNWSNALTLAKNGLRFSKNEEIRDECLNIMAASLAMSSDSERALDALKKAVEGKWNIELQTNLAIIATSVEPNLAVRHMSYLISGAKTFAERIKSCHMAIGLWRSSQIQETGSKDDDDFEPLPGEVLTSIHALVGNREIDEESFYDLGIFLARVDSDGFKSSRVIEKSPHAQSLSAQAIQVRFDGYYEFATKIIGIAAKDKNGCAPWLRDAAETVVREVATGLADDDDSQIFFNLSFKFLSDGLDCSSFNRIAIRGFLADGLIANFKGKDTQPSDDFIKWVQEGHAAVTENKIGMSDDAKAFVTESLQRTGNVLGLLIHKATVSTGVNVENSTNAIVREMSGFMKSFTGPGPQIKNTSQHIWEWCDESIKTFHKVLWLVFDTDIQRAILDLITKIDKIKHKVDRYR